MIGMTMCSGIGAPEVAAPWVDWRLASEIEPFPRAVLCERFGYKLPEDHNQGDPLLWGDMTEVSPDLLRQRGIPLPDVIVAGTPCQAFSIAGLRKGTEDARGNLTLTFVELCHAIVDARPDGKLAVLWENVPGVLSDKGNAFGCFLGGLVGAMDAVLPGEKPATGKSNQFWKWHKGGKSEILDDEGEGTGEFETVKPHHRVSWPGEGMVQGPRARAAWSVLDAQWFGVAQRRRRVFVVVDFGDCIDPAAVLLEPDRLRGNTPPRRETGQDVAGTLSARTEGGGGLGTDFDLAGGLQPDWPAEVASTLNTHFGSKMGLEDQHALGGAGLFVPDTTGPLTAGMGKGPRGTEGVESNHIVCATGPTTHALTAEGHDASEDGTGRGTPIVVHGTQNPCIQDDVAFAIGRNNGGENAVAFDTTQITSPQNGNNPQPGDPCHPLAAGAHPPALAFDLRGRDGGAQFEGPHETANLRAASGGSSRSYVASAAVRRLMPVECERLQGFPDGHTAITYRGKPASDGPRYKGLGNSMPVPVIRWIMNRMKQSWEQHS